MTTTCRMRWRQAEIARDAVLYQQITAPETKPFEIGGEDPRLRDRYGRNRFGQSCLLARRLIESGVRFVTVTDPGWDTHAGQLQVAEEQPDAARRSGTARRC